MSSYRIDRDWSTLPPIGPVGFVHHTELTAHGVWRCLPSCPACHRSMRYLVAAAQPVGVTAGLDA